MRSPISTAAFVRLIFLKDVRAARYPLLLLLAFMIAIIGITLNFDPTATLLNPSLWRFVLLAGMLLLTIYIIQSDPTGREFRFLLTRPVPGSAVGLAKLLFLTMFVLLPYWLSLELIIAGSRIPLTPLDHLLFLIETVIPCGAALSTAVLLSVFLRNGLIVLCTYVGFFITTNLLTMWWQTPSFHAGVMPPWPDPGHQRLVQFRAFLAQAVFFGSTLIAIGIRYYTRGFKIPMAVAVGGIALSYLFYSFFPYNLAQSLEDQTSNRSLLTPEQLGRIHMVLVRHSTHQPSYSLSGGDWNGIYYVNLNQIVQLEGIESPYFVQTIGYHTIITLRSGKTITSDYTDFNGHEGVGGVNSTFTELVAGTAPSGSDQKELTLDLMTYLPRNLPDEDITGATVKGVITLDVRRAYVAAAIPLRPHASFGTHRRSYEITDADFSGDGVSFNLNVSQLPLLLRGDLANWNTPDDLKWIPVYRPFHYLLQPDSTGGGGWSGIGIQVNHQHGSYIWPIEGTISDWRPLPADWTSGAKLVFIGSDSCGHITCPYEIDNVDLHYRF